MLQFNILSAAAAALSLYAQTVSALNPIAVQGQNFVDSVTGKRFEIIGITYQPGGQDGFNPALGFDPLSNGAHCLRDAALMQRLGINTIRVYNLDPALNHDLCASIFNAAGIYMMIDVNSPLDGQSINRANPGPSYTASYLQRVFRVMDNFRQYPNTLGFVSANELVNNDQNGRTDPPYIRAVQRDMKQYLQARGGRKLPVGYAATDVRNIVLDTLNYLQCAINGNQDDMSRSDFFGLNCYSWCGPQATFKTAQYGELVGYLTQSTIPGFFAEYGCNQPQPRVFNEVLALYGKKMTVFSGGLIYEYSQETNNYGIVKINTDGSANLLTEYQTLQNKLGRIDLNLISSRNETAVNRMAPACRAGLISESGFSTSFNIPRQPAGAAQLIKNGAGGRVGQLVQVQQTTVSQNVTDWNGNVIQNLAIHPTQGSNTPGAVTQSGNSGAASMYKPSAVVSISLVSLALWFLS